MHSHQQHFMEQNRRVQSLKDDNASGASFLFRAPRLNSRAEALATFPTKTETDRLVGRYFDSYDPAVHIIHGPTFQTRYDQHWQDPSQTPLIFIALLYAIMALALQSYHRANDEPPEYNGKSLELSVAFRRLTAQTLSLADVKDCRQETLQTLILHTQAEVARSPDAETGILLLVSLMVRMAMRMGYHRDPGPYPDITPFQGELRRRLWTAVRQIDLLFSFQFGLASITRADGIDTQVPRNLYDDELYEGMPTLPPSRPDNEPTPVSYMIAKSKLISRFGKIVDRITSVVNLPSYEEIMDLDSQLREEHANLPPFLQMRAMHETSPIDSADIIMQRYGLELLYLKSLCVLHRRYVGKGRESQRFGYSYRTCIDASMDMLAHAATLHQESRPSGRLQVVKWYISSLTTQDFLLAAMIVCLDLYHSAQSESRTRKPSSAANTPPNAHTIPAERREQMLNSLRHCVGIWESQRDQSMEAYKASSMLNLMVEKLMAHQARKGARNAYANPETIAAQPRVHGSNFMFPNGNVNMSDDNNDVPPEHSAALTLGLLSSGGVSPNRFGSSAPNAQQQQANAAGQDGRTYPTSMAGLLNDQIPERTALTPRPEQSGSASTSSPFGGMFGGAGMGANTDGLFNGGDIDWVSLPLLSIRLRACITDAASIQNAWDSFVQGVSLDPISMLPPMDFASPPPQTQQQAGNNVDPQLQAHSGAPSTNTGTGGVGAGNSGVSNGIFMGATTPNTAGLM